MHDKLILIIPPVGRKELNRRWNLFRVMVKVSQGFLVIPYGVEPDAVLAMFGADWAAEIVRSNYIIREADGSEYRWANYSDEIRRVLGVKFPRPVSARKYSGA